MDEAGIVEGLGENGLVVGSSEGRSVQKKTPGSRVLYRIRVGYWLRTTAFGYIQGKIRSETMVFARFKLFQGLAIHSDKKRLDFGPNCGRVA
ncbi:hypothetical protein MAN_10596, partial [Metarhizium hybridum]